MISNDRTAASAVSLLTPASAADTAAATGSWVSLDGYEGYAVVIQHVGAITGTLDGKLRHADDDSGTNAADITGATFTQVTTANDNPNIQKLVVRVSGLKPYIQYLGTVGTGPSVVGVSMLSAPKYS